jgi:hypothetical protein
MTARANRTTMATPDAHITAPSHNAISTPSHSVILSLSKDAPRP